MKKINRNNYEEYFLLYIDEELSAQQKKEVELFIQSNPDLIGEFEMLQQTKLHFTEINSFDKTILYKKKTAIDLSNAEEFFLLQIDNELNKDQQFELNEFLQQHPEIRKQLAELKQTILPQEKIEFKNKRLLYKKEKNEKVFYLDWMKIAVAAALIGFSIMIWDLTAVNKKPAAYENQSTNLQTKQKNNSLAINQIAEINPAQNSNIISQPATNATHLSNKKKLNQEDPSKEITVNKNQQLIPQPVAIIQNKNYPTDNLTGNNISLPSQNISADEPLAQHQDKQAKANDNSSGNIIHPATYQEINTADDDQSLYIGNIELNKNKVRCLLKKASRIFGSRAKDSTEHNIKISDLNINTKNL